MKTWHNARLACERNDSVLASVASRREQSALNAFQQEVGLTGQIWIGVSTAAIAFSDFHWINQKSFSGPAAKLFYRWHLSVFCRRNCFTWFRYPIFQQHLWHRRFAIMHLIMKWYILLHVIQQIILAYIPPVYLTCGLFRLYHAHRLYVCHFINWAVMNFDLARTSATIWLSNPWKGICNVRYTYSAVEKVHAELG